MALLRRFCPECGQETRINDEKAFSFCLKCGAKIVLSSEMFLEEREENGKNKSEEICEDIEKRLEEVAFYYQLSKEKGEDANYNAEPVYYLKAQDILVDLSQVYPDDYRIWWEMCKPIDFNNAKSGTDIYGRYCINEDYFGKALDKADLQVKRIIIDEHDRYISEKKAQLKKAEERRLEEEQREQEELRREEERRLEEERERKQKQEEEKEKERAEEQARLQIEEENLKKGLELSAPIWKSLYNKDYRVIDNSFFNIPIENNQSIIGVFKNVSNLLYLIAFQIESENVNVIYRCQTVPIKFDGSGHVIKADNTLLKFKSAYLSSENLFISSNVLGELSVNNMKLYNNAEYVTTLMKNARKPKASTKKYFY